jgi:hypothetical protein
MVGVHFVTGKFKSGLERLRLGFRKYMSSQAKKEMNTIFIRSNKFFYMVCKSIKIYVCSGNTKSPDQN